jgi:hypothetical protein
MPKTIAVSDVTVPTLNINTALYSDRKMPVHVRMEQRIVAALIAHMEVNGWAPVDLYDGEEHSPVTDAKSAMELIFNLDDSYLTFSNGSRKHWVRLIGGNGVDILSDYSFAHEDRPDDFDTVISAFDAEVYA